MSQEVNFHSSVSEEAVLELLLGSGLGREQALSLIDHGPEQSSLTLSPDMGQRPHPEEAGASQSAQLSAFERSVMMTLERLNQRLDNLSAKVGEGDRVFTPSPPPSITATPVQKGAGRAWADIPVGEVPDYSIPVVWEDEADDSASGPLQTVSEGTGKALKAAFSRPLSNQTRLQTRKPYVFPDVDTTRCPKLDLVAK